MSGMFLSRLPYKDNSPSNDWCIVKLGVRLWKDAEHGQKYIKSSCILKNIPYIFPSFRSY